jgi:hypothetical protein
MRKFFGIGLLAVMLIIAFYAVAPMESVEAQARYGLQRSSAVETSTALVLPAKTWVYGMTIFADAANSFMGIYNAATLGACTATTVKDEIGEATQYDTAEKWYAKPEYFADGVSVVMSTGVGFIYYGPEPSR